jgi:hypothetical protein
MVTTVSSPASSLARAAADEAKICQGPAKSSASTPSKMKIP